MQTQISSTGQDIDALINDLPVAVYTCDAEGYLTYYNNAAAVLWGRDPEIGKDSWCGSWKMFYPDGKPMPLHECPMALTLKNGRSYAGEEIIIERPDHTYRRLLVHPTPIFNASNILTGAHDTLVDITGQKQDEEKQAILSAIVESSDDAIISKNLNGVITSWNAGAQKIFGYTEKEIIGKYINVLIPDELQSEEEVIISNIKAGNKIDHFQTIRISKSGKRIPISITVSPVRDSKGNIIGASKIARDISERIQKDELIIQSAQRLDILYSIARTIAEKLDSKTILQKVTDETTKITGAAFGAFFYNTESRDGESYMLYALSGASKTSFDKFGMPRSTAIFHPTFTGQSIIRVDDITKDSRYGNNPPHYGIPPGHLSVISYMAIPVISVSGAVLGALLFGHPKAGIFNQEHEDIVVSIASQASVALDNSRLFEEVKALNKKKDEFIALTSHELKTPITSLKGYLQLIERKEADELNKTFIKKSLQQLERLNNLINELLDISKIEVGKLELNYELFDPARLIADIADTFKFTATTHSIIFDAAVTGVMLEADKQRVEQVIVNLLNNAIKYSPNASKAYISLSNTTDLVVIKVRDEGIGLTREQQKLVFDKFYRAEQQSTISGLGLGLYLSKEIVERHNGTLEVQSEPGKGAQFTLSLPCKKN